MRITRRIGRASLTLAIAALSCWHVQTGRAITTLDSGSSNALFTHTQAVDGGSPLQNIINPLDISSGALMGGVLSSADDVTVGVAGANPLPSYPLVGLSTGTSVTQTRGSGSFTTGDASVGQIDLDIRYDIDNALSANTYAYFYTLANLVVAGPGDEASINVNLDYTLNKADGGGTETVNIMAGDDAAGTSKFNTTVFGFGQIPNATAAAPSAGTHVLEITGTITMAALDPIAGAKSNGLHNHKIEWTAFEDPGDASAWTSTDGSVDWISLASVQPNKVPVTSIVPGLTQAFRFSPTGMPPGGFLSTSSAQVEGISNRDLTGDSATFELWLRPQLIGVQDGREQLIMEFGSPANGLSFSLAPVPDTPNAAFQLAVAGGGQRSDAFVQFPQSFLTGDFIHVVGVVDMENNLLELHVNDPTGVGSLPPNVVSLNGVNDWSDPDFAGLGAPSTDGVGGSAGSIFFGLDNYDSFDGDIAVIRIFDFAMDEKEIAGLFGLNQDASRIEDEISALLRASLLTEGYTDAQITTFLATLPPEVLRTPGGGLLSIDFAPDGNGGGANGIPEPASATLIVLAGAAMLRRRRQHH